MDTIFMNSENSRTSDRLLNLSDQINLKSKYKYVALSNLSIYYTRKNISHTKIINSKYQLQHGMKDPILCQIFQIILNISLKKT